MTIRQREFRSKEDCSKQILGNTYLPELQFLEVRIVIEINVGPKRNGWMDLLNISECIFQTFKTNRTLRASRKIIFM